MSEKPQDQYYAHRDEQYVELAKRFDQLGELCTLMDHHPDHGRVPQYWRPLYPQFFEAARALGAVPGARTHRLDVVHPSVEPAFVSAGADKCNEAVEEKLAAALGWERQPREPNELFHRWKRPSGTLREGRPHWTVDSKEAFILAADLEIGTSYGDGVAIASFVNPAGGTVHVEEDIANHRDKLGAMRTAIARAALVKVEAQMNMQPANGLASGPQ